MSKKKNHRLVKQKKLSRLGLENQKKKKIREKKEATLMPMKKKKWQLAT